MSSQKGNTQKARGQKHQNKTAFKNNLHDGTSWKRRQINSVVATGVCHRCKDAIDWKIQYKKYKPLSQPRTCNKCRQKTVKQAYYTICTPCAQSIGVCQKCGEEKEIAIGPGLSAAEQASRDAELKFELKRLSERQRRTFFRLQQSGKLKAGSAGDRGDNLGSHDEPVNVAASGDRGDNLESPDDSLSAESENESDTEIDVNVEVPFSAADTASVLVGDLCDPDSNNIQT